MFTRVPGVWSVKQSTWLCPIKVTFLSKNIHISDTHLWPLSCLHHCLWWTIPWEEATFWQIISNESNFQTTIYSKVWIFQSWQDLSNIFRRRGHQKEKSGTHSDAWTGWHVGPVNHRQSPYGYGSIPIDTFLVGWTSIYQLFWGSLGTRVLTHSHMDPQLSRWFLNLNSPNQYRSQRQPRGWHNMIKIVSPGPCNFNSEYLFFSNLQSNRQIVIPS